MPRLLLLRHAKSSWDKGVTDRDRPLAPRGVEAARRIAREIVARDLLPDRIVCSPARRTRETLAALEPLLAKGCAIDIVPELYESGGDYRDTILTSHAGAQKLLVVGHNPATHATAVGLVVNAGPDLLSKYPTGALAVIDLPGKEWSLRPGSGRLAAFIRPRDLDADADED